MHQSWLEWGKSDREKKNTSFFSVCCSYNDVCKWRKNRLFVLFFIFFFLHHADLYSWDVVCWIMRNPSELFLKSEIKLKDSHKMKLMYADARRWVNFFLSFCCGWGVERSRLRLSKSNYSLLYLWLCADRESTRSLTLRVRQGCNRCTSMDVRMERLKEIQMRGH